jgi:hypothetical protein
LLIAVRLALTAFAPHSAQRPRAKEIAMTMTTVSRRVAGFAKVKKAAKPHAPMPRRDTPNVMGGRRTTPVVTVPVERKEAIQRTWWQRAAKPVGMAIGALACCGCIFVVATAKPAATGTLYAYRADSESAPVTAPSRAAQTSTGASLYSGSDAPQQEIVLSNRSTPTDESFLASAYVRRKVSLPNISGNCVVTGSGSRDVGECLRQQMER